MIIFSSHRMEHVELFCKKIVVLLRGKDVLSGEIKDIKKKYRKKNIFIKGDIDLDSIKKVKGVLDAYEFNDGYKVQIENDDMVSNVFNYIKKCDNVTAFVVEEPSLNEIFISKVGEAYEK